MGIWIHVFFSHIWEIQGDAWLDQSWLDPGYENRLSGIFLSLSTSLCLSLCLSLFLYLSLPLSLNPFSPQQFQTHLLFQSWGEVTWLSLPWRPYKSCKRIMIGSALITWLPPPRIKYIPWPACIMCPLLKKAGRTNWVTAHEKQCYCQ